MSDELQIVNSLVKAEDPNFSYEEIIKMLTPPVNHLLDSDMNSLMNILYRIDVSEQKLKETLATSKPEEVGEKVSRLILDRQIQKIETRRKYSS